jgi:hypothetical protein
MRQIFVIGGALFAGFIGGLLGTMAIRTRVQPNIEQVIRARSFELVDERGQTISFWGVDQGNTAILAFGSHWPKISGDGSIPGPPSLGLADPHNQRVAIGVTDDDPFVYLRGRDGKTRVRLYLSDYAKPLLLMEDETGPRVALGIDQSDTPGPQDNDWSLTFNPERVWLGMRAEKVTGETYVRGGFAVHKDRTKYPPEQPK